MHRKAMFVLALAALVAAGALLVRVLGSPPSQEPMAPSTHAAGPELGDLERRLARLESRVFEPRLEPHDPHAILAALERRLRVLEERPASAPTRPSVAGARAVPAHTDDSARTMSDEDLLARAKSLAGRTGSSEAAPYWQELIDRRPTTDVLLDAQYGLGLSLRAQKQHEKEEAAFLEVARLAGSDSPRAQEAMFQIAWSRYFRKDAEGSRRAMEEVARSPASRKDLTGHARLHAAHCSLELNDATRARELLESMVRDFSGSVQPMHTWFLEQAEHRLKTLEGR